MYISDIMNKDNHSVGTWVHYLFMTKSLLFSDITARIVRPFQHSRRSRDFHHLPTAQYLAHGG